jgi:hypothetical protein
MSEYQGVCSHSAVRIKEIQTGWTNEFQLSAAAETALPHSIQVSLVLAGSFVEQVKETEY